MLKKLKEVVILSPVGVHTGEDWAATKEQSVSVQTCELPDWSSYNKWCDFFSFLFFSLFFYFLFFAFVKEIQLKKKKKNEIIFQKKENEQRGYISSIYFLLRWEFK